MSRPMRQLLRGKAEAKDHSDQPLDAALNQASYCEMEVAFADGSGYSVGIRARAATEALSPAWKRPSLERPNSVSIHGVAPQSGEILQVPDYL
jgi:hypothetical protein